MQASSVQSDKDDDDISMQEMYCASCNIQFSSMKTYKGHKEFYCSMRNNLKSDTDRNHRDAAAVEAQAQAQAQAQVQAMAANQILSNGVPPPGTILPPGTVFPVQGMLPNGSIAMPLAQTPQGVVMATPIVDVNGMTKVTFNVPTMIMPPVLEMPNNSLQAHQRSPVAAGKSSTTTPSATATSSSSKDELPLDLSKKNSESPVKNQRTKAEATSSPDGSVKKETDEEEPEDLSTKSSIKSSKSPVQSLSSRPSTPVSQAGSHRSSPGSSRLDQPLPTHPVLPNPALMAAAAAAAMLPQQAAAFTQAAQMAAAAAANTISKCVECDILFYKHENYVAHKEHYCSGRRRRSSGRDLDQPDQGLPPQGGDRPPDLASSRSSSSCSPIAAINGSAEAVSNIAAKAISDVLTVQGNLLRYFCRQCETKFSSHDTLKAHQEFYCRGREMAENKDGAGSRSPGSSSGGETPEIEGNFPCHYCGNCYSTNRLLKRHYCKANSVQIPLLRCPYCEYITQSDNKLVDHIKMHAPTRAFKCTLCGYRGNTVRGMRMHGKTHLDAGKV